MDKCEYCTGKNSERKPIAKWEDNYGNPYSIYLVFPNYMRIASDNLPNSWGETCKEKIKYCPICGAKLKTI